MYQIAGFNKKLDAIQTNEKSIKEQHESAHVKKKGFSIRSSACSAPRRRRVVQALPRPTPVSSSTKESRPRTTCSTFASCQTSMAR